MKKIRKSILLATALAFVLQASVTYAHFIWLSPQKNKDGSTTIQVYFGEDAAADNPEYLNRVKDMQLFQVRGKDAGAPVALAHSTESLSAKLDDYRGQSLFVGSHDLGTMERGDTTFRLKYYAKTGPSISSPTWQTAQTSDDLRLDVVPTLADGKIVLSVLFDKKPVANAEVKASGPGLEDFTGKTNESGQATFPMASAGIYSIRARHVEAVGGELKETKYGETRHYSTLAVDIPSQPPLVPAETIASVPDEVTSFGAAILDNKLYMYGGHTGDAHSYSTQEQSNSLIQLDVKTKEWKTLAQGPHLQGLALVANKTQLFRIGGFTAKNKAGEDHDLWSQTSVASFDLKQQQWHELPALPEPRSSHDAAVVNGQIYVVGGWSMQGTADKHWHTTAWKLNPAANEPKWEPVPTPPFQRRAIATAAHDGKLFVLGGMQAKGGPTKRVDVFDPASGKWTQTGELQGDDAMAGFGVSAFATGGSLFATTVKGTLQRLAKDGSTWEIVGRTPTPRFFHRLLPLDNQHLLVVGGANMGIGKFEEIEVLSVTPSRQK